jgi:hypothetical protein
MDARELAHKFSAKVAAAASERRHQETVATESAKSRLDDMVHIKRAMEQHVIPFLRELEHHFGANQFSFAPQVDIDHKPVGVSFKIGDGAPTVITSAFGNIVVTRWGASGSSKGIAFVYPPDAEPYISNSGDLTREKIAKLVELVIDNSAG